MKGGAIVRIWYGQLSLMNGTDIRNVSALTTLRQCSRCRVVIDANGGHIRYSHTDINISAQECAI